MAQKISGRSSRGGMPMPQCKALLLCEKATANPESGEFSLTRLFHVIQIPRFPGESSSFMAFIRLYDGFGPFNLLVEIRNLGSDGETAQMTLPGLDFPERLLMMDLAVAFDFVRFPHAGRYEIAIKVGSRELARTAFDVEVG